MQMIFVVVVLLILVSCCLMRYAAMQLHGGGGKHGRGGGAGIRVFALYCSGIWHITGLVGLSFCVQDAYHLV